MWVDNFVYTLTYKDRELVTSPTGWHTDKIINASQLLMLQHFPSMKALQPPTLKEVLAFEVHLVEFVQIINVANNHWCVLSTVGCDSGVVHVYDSLDTPLSDKTVSSMMYSATSQLKIVMMDVKKQTNFSDCGVLAIAYVFHICSGSNPCTVKYDHKNLRQHCLEKCQFTGFPQSGKRRSRAGMVKTVELHC